MATIYNHLFLVKSEATPQVDAVPTAALNAIRSLTRAAPTVNRSNVQRTVVKQTMGELPHLADPDASIQFTIEVELKGSGVAGVAPRYAPLLKACGMVETVAAGTSVTYDPSSTVVTPCSIYQYIDGVLFKGVGCVGTCAITSNIGEFDKATFTMSAAYIAPTAALTLPTGVVFDASKPHVVSSADLVTDGGSINVSTFAIDMGNEITPHKTRGGHEFTVSNRAPTATLNKDSVSTVTEWQAIDASTSATLLSTTNGGAGNIVKLGANNAVRDSVALGERGEKYTLEVAYKLYETGSDDQFYVEFT